jgi:CDP-diacylglycerol--glycerol-3-phosphate 3-phosphatidyltransferase
MLVRSGDGTSAAATVIFVAAALTDFLDGLMARRTATVTELGRVLDPLADRLLIGATVISLTIVGALPVVGVALVVARDIFLVIGYKLLERRRVVIRVSMIGKSYTALFMVAIVATMAGIELAGINLGLVLFWLSVAGSLLSGAGYVARGLSALQARSVR